MLVKAHPIMRREATRLAAQHRTADLTPSTYDATARTVELNAATSYRVKRGYWEPYWEQLKIAADAIDLERVEKGQCPLLDTHSRWSVNDQFGSVIASRIEGSVLILKVQFADNDRGREIEARVASGDLKGVSIGYRVNEMTLVGRLDDIPIMEITRWELLEVSLVPVPADPDSGVRSAPEDLYPCIVNLKQRTSVMDPTIEEIAAAQAALTRSDATTEQIAAANDVLSRARAATARRAAANPGAPAAPLVETRAAPVAVPANVPAAPAVEARASEILSRWEPADVLDFTDAARSVGLEDEVIRTMVTTKTPDQARLELVRAAGKRQNEASPPIPAGQAARIQRDEVDTSREALSEAMLHRADSANELTEKGRMYRGMSLREMARQALTIRGVRTQGMTPREMFNEIRAHSSSDFGNAINNTANKTLRNAYETAGQTFKIWQKKATASDFKQISRVQLSGAPTLFEVPEGGEYTMGTLLDGKEVYQLAKYGRLLNFTWEMFINDDLGAFSRLATMLGRAASDFESDVAYAPLLANPAMGDGVTLFHASHGNLAGSGTAYDEANVNAAEIAMGSQKGLEGRFLNIRPKFAISGMKHALTINKLNTTVAAATTGNVNTYAGRFTPVIEQRLNGGVSATPWFLAADPNQVDTIEYCYLEGEEGVHIDQEQSFVVDAITYKVRTVIASKAVDHRGMYKNPGTT